MAQILVRWKDNFHPDPIIDRRGCYKCGYPVVVMPDNHIWGKMECLPDFVVVKVPDVPIEKVQKYIGMHQEPRQQTLKWNKLDWEERQRTRTYDPFLSVPAVLGESSEVQTISINIISWLRQIAEGNYSPFYINYFPLPKTMTTEGENYQIQGTIVNVDLQGDIMTIITRRLWKIRCDDMPLVARNKFRDAGYLTIKATNAYKGVYDFTWTQVKTYFWNLQTELAEIEDLV